MSEREFPLKDLLADHPEDYHYLRSLSIAAATGNEQGRSAAIDQIAEFMDDGREWTVTQEIHDDKRTIYLSYDPQAKGLLVDSISLSTRVEYSQERTIEYNVN